MEPEVDAPEGARVLQPLLWSWNHGFIGSDGYSVKAVNHSDRWSKLCDNIVVLVGKYYHVQQSDPGSFSGMIE